MIGLGYHETILPAVIQRNVLENPGWYTAYTPYQAEISQGRLEALLNFQQMVCDLTGMPIANASLLDEATAAAEAMTMLQRVNRKSRSRRFLIDPATLPQTLDVVRNRARYFDIEIVEADPLAALADGDFFGVLLQYPGADGAVTDHRETIEAAHRAGALVAVAADLLSLVLLTPPGEMGADAVVGMRFATSEVASSGKLVPSATTVTEMACSLIPNEAATPAAPFTSRLAPRTNPAEETRTSSRETGMEYLDLISGWSLLALRDRTIDHITNTTSPVTNNNPCQSSRFLSRMNR